MESSERSPDRILRQAGLHKSDIETLSPEFIRIPDTSEGTALVRVPCCRYQTCAMDFEGDDRHRRQTSWMDGAGSRNLPPIALNAAC
jgi:hypothetical protein